MAPLWVWAIPSGKQKASSWALELAQTLTTATSSDVAVLSLQHVVPLKIVRRPPSSMMVTELL